MSRGRLHHAELWVPSLDRAERSWGWLLTTLGYTEHQRWDAGLSWILDGTYVVVEQMGRHVRGSWHTSGHA